MLEKIQGIWDDVLYYRQIIKKYYAEYSPYVIMAVKFFTMLALFLTINAHFHTIPFLSRPALILAVSLFCSVLPHAFISVFSALILTAQLAGLTVSGALLFVALVFLISVMRYLMLPGCGIVLAVLPMLFAWRIPFMVPLIVGLAGTAGSFAVVGGGVVIYYLLSLCYLSAPYLADPGASLVEHLLYLVKGLAASREMYLVLAFFCLTTLIVWLISRLSVNYSHYIAIGAGALFNMTVLIIGSAALGITSLKVWQVILGTLLALVVAGLYEFFKLSLDYARTEHVSFEDDEFVYYVKAVPKVVVPERADPETDLFDEADQALMTAYEPFPEDDDEN